MAAMGYEVTTTEGYDLTGADGTLLNPNDFSLMCILADSEARAADADNQAMTLVGRIAKIYDAKSHDGKRLEVQLVLRNQTTLWMIQNVDLRSDLNDLALVDDDHTLAFIDRDHGSVGNDVITSLGVGASAASGVSALADKDVRSERIAIEILFPLIGENAVC